MSKVQDCPFCGGSVTYSFFEPDGLGDYEPEHHFTCDGCDIIVILVDVSASQAIENYNQRAKDEG